MTCDKPKRCKHERTHQAHVDIAAQLHAILQDARGATNHEQQ